MWAWRAWRGGSAGKRRILISIFHFFTVDWKTRWASEPLQASRPPGGWLAGRTANIESANMHDCIYSMFAMSKSSQANMLSQESLRREIQWPQDLRRKDLFISFLFFRVSLF